MMGIYFIIKLIFSIAMMITYLILYDGIIVSKYKLFIQRQFNNSLKDVVVT